MKAWLKQSPVLTKTARKLLSLVPASVRLGRPFWYWYGFFLESEGWSPEEITRWQLERLKILLSSLTDRFPYYQSHITSAQIERMNSLSDFVRYLPTQSREQFKQLQTTVYGERPDTIKVSHSASSGTTGRPLIFFHNYEDDYREWASLSAQWKRAGFDPVQSVRMEFRGEVPTKNRIEVFPDQRMVRVSVLHLSGADITRYADTFVKYKVTHLHGFPSAIALLAERVIKEKIRFPMPQGILLASEQVHPWQVAKIEQAFPESIITAHYGCAERTVMAGWCEKSRVYHVVPTYSVVEIDNETKEIIGTNLFNTVNPFIRYRMTDTVLEPLDQLCPACHRPYQPLFKQIGGRMEDYLYSPETGWIPPASVTYALKKLQTITEMQFVQKEKRALIFRFSAQSNSDKKTLAAEVQEVTTGLNKLLGASCAITTERVESFERTRAGKFKWIISELDESPTKN